MIFLAATQLGIKTVPDKAAQWAMTDAKGLHSDAGKQMIAGDEACASAETQRSQDDLIGP